MNFVEGQEAVAVAAVIHERRLKRGLYARHLGQIDIALEKFSGSAFVIEFLYAAVPENHHPSLLRVGGIDKHLVVRHFLLSFARRRDGPTGPALEPEATVGRWLARAFF